MAAGRDAAAIGAGGTLVARLLVRSGSEPEGAKLRHAGREHNRGVSENEVAKGYFGGRNEATACQQASRCSTTRPVVRKKQKNVRVNILAVKLIVTPLMILAASLAGRRWGDALGGWLVGLPLTSGPVAVFLAVEHGADFAVEASAGSLAGVTAQAGFCLGYALAAPWGWPVALVGGAGAFAASAAALQAGQLAPKLLFALAFGALIVTLRLLPRDFRPPAPARSPWWEIPMRMALVTGLVVAVTSFASLLGARASGVVATFPLIGAALGVFAHRAHGPRAGVAVLRGMTSALFAFAFFFFVVGLAIPRAGIVLGFSAATVAALVVQAATLRLVGVAMPRSAA